MSVSMVADRRIQVGQQLSHAGDKRDLLECACRKSGASRSLEWEVVTRGGQGGHVQRPADFETSADDSPSPSAGAGIVGERGVVVALDVGNHFGFDVVELLGDGRKDRFDTGTRDGPCKPQALPFRQLHGDELTAPGGQHRQGLLFGLRQRPGEALGIGSASDYVGEFSQRVGVDPVSLGQNRSKPGVQRASRPRMGIGHSSGR